MSHTRLAAVAGSFYPAESTALSHLVQHYLNEPTSLATQPDSLPEQPPKALIVPHAGYIYSGVVAAQAFRLLQPFRKRIHRVILLGPVHRVAVRGLALPGADAFSTPLGSVAIDAAAVQRIESLPQVSTSVAAHAWEHSLEVQLPFLQTVLHDFTLLPLAVGDATPDEVAEVLERLWGEDDTLIVISSDLSHYLSYDQAKRSDSQTVARILQFDHHISHHEACGATPVNGLLELAQRHHLRAYLLDLRNSGDTEGDKDRVVGYSALAFYEADHAQH